MSDITKPSVIEVDLVYGDGYWFDTDQTDELVPIEETRMTPIKVLSLCGKVMHESPNDSSRAEVNRLYKVNEALSATCDAQGRKLADIEKALQPFVNIANGDSSNKLPFEAHTILTVVKTILNRKGKQRGM